ncbi:MAG: class F sortase [Dehalococcoidia bacterium]|nr:class F sortase [Dehalococcoidia bacterium]MCB9486183.1 class F sortase [Thermoflexaceae bacterium]
MMNVRFLPLVLLAAGAIGALALAACGGSSAAETPAAGATTSLPAPSATATPTMRPTNTPTPVPTPTPYNGRIARFQVPGLGIDAPIEELAINSLGELDTPKAENVAVGWYYIYDKPGRLNPDNRGWVDFGGKQIVNGFTGNSVFSAHVYYHNVPAPFQKMAQAKAGDQVLVTMEDGRQYKYEVVSNQQYNRDTIPMGDIIWPKQKPADEEWITMITCGGELDATGWEYLSRDVVVARRIP